MTTFGRLRSGENTRRPCAAINFPEFSRLPGGSGLVIQLHESVFIDWNLKNMATRSPEPRPFDGPKSGYAEDSRLRILLVDDENSMLLGLSAALRSGGYNVCLASGGEDALRKYQSSRPELILLDLSLLGTAGRDILRRLRRLTGAPIIVISERGEESEIIAYLDAGANDYVSRPVATGELLARVRAALRTAFGDAQTKPFTEGELKVDFNRREVFVGCEQVGLTATEYHLLAVLVRHAGMVRTHYQLIHEVWGGTQYGDAVHLLRVTVSNLRRKLARDSTLTLPIVTEPGVGYRLRSNSRSLQAAG
jgi:two-component system KDP operon response regulator KdpE